MNRHSILLVVLAIVALMALGSCEKIIDFDRDTKSRISISALVAPGQKFSACIARSFTVASNPTVSSTKKPGDDLDFHEKYDTMYHDLVVIKDATAVLTVNGTDTYALQYNDSTPYYYTCDYVPRVGDELVLNVSAPGFDDASASTRIERPQQVEVVGTQVYYSEAGYEPGVPASDQQWYCGLDSVMEITLRIHDPAGERNYYRLRVLAVADDSMAIMQGISLPVYVTNDTYTSSDVIFANSLITKPYGQWPAGQSSVFDDHLFDGQDYTFKVHSRKQKGKNPRVYVELETISPDFYYYWRSYEVIRVNADESYLTPTALYSNVQGGWGVMMSLSYDRHTISY